MYLNQQLFLACSWFPVHSIVFQQSIYFTGKLFLRGIKEIEKCSFAIIKSYSYDAADIKRICKLLILWKNWVDDVLLPAAHVCVSK